jgi:non-heme chloroperoxidase
MATWGRLSLTPSSQRYLLKTYKGFPHGMPTTQADTINADLLAFLKA